MGEGLWLVLLVPHHWLCGTCPPSPAESPQRGGRPDPRALAPWPLGCWCPPLACTLTPISSVGASCLSYASHRSLYPHSLLFSRLLAEGPLLGSICCKSVPPGVCSVPTASATCQVPSALQTPPRKAKSPLGGPPSYLHSHSPSLPCAIFPSDLMWAGTINGSSTFYLARDVGSKMFQKTPSWGGECSFSLSP